MKHLVLDLIVTSGVTAILLWHWASLLPRVLSAVQPVAAAALDRRRKIEQLHEEPAI